MIRLIWENLWLLLSLKGERKYLKRLEAKRFNLLLSNKCFKGTPYAERMRFDNALKYIQKQFQLSRKHCKIFEYRIMRNKKVAYLRFKKLVVDGNILFFLCFIWCALLCLISFLFF